MSCQLSVVSCQLSVAETGERDEVFLGRWITPYESNCGAAIITGQRTTNNGQLTTDN